MELNLTRPIAFFDLETTGIKVATDRIVEISIVRVQPGGETRIKTMRINPEMPIPPEVIQIHGITDDDVKDCPVFRQVAADLARFLDGCDLAGYNSNHFDIPLLVEEFLRAGVEFELKGRRFIDVQNIFHKMEPRNLRAAYQFYCSKELENAHSAEADTLATYEILKAQLDRYTNVMIKDKRGNLIQPVVNDMQALSDFSYSTRSVDLIGHIVYNDKNVETFNFGKHKGKPVLQVFRDEPSYYDWMMKSEFPLSTKKVITALKLKEFNNSSVKLDLL
ncbi:MAG TPA: 3'-5' exonuclease [Bacteroidales bacterium]|nr:3'-5' exonuclease [Bacteroidales bacterium]HPS62354.1 3'-5' exonuclease [Bacteroidales bacterium]